MKYRNIATTLAVAVLSALGAPAWAQTTCVTGNPDQVCYLGNNAGFDLIGAYQTAPESGARYDQVLLNYQNYPIYQVQIPNVRAGDLLVINAEGGVTSELTQPVEVASQLVWEDGSGGACQYAPCVEISEENGENVVKTPEHHHKVTQTGIWLVPAGTPDNATRYVTWLWRAQSTAYPFPPVSWINVDMDHGRLIVMHYRPRS